MIEVNGMAHVILTVSQWEKARAFYGELLPFLGLQKVYDGNNFLYHVGGRTAVGIQRCAAEHARSASTQNRVGLHHLCLRARIARGRRPGGGEGSRHGRPHRPRPDGGRLGAGLLLLRLRGSRRHPARSQLHPRQGPARLRPADQSQRRSELGPEILSEGCIAVLNAGSSSIKFALYDGGEDARCCSAARSRRSASLPRLRADRARGRRWSRSARWAKGASTTAAPGRDPEARARTAARPADSAVGHRVVHGGTGTRRAGAGRRRMHGGAENAGAARAAAPAAQPRADPRDRRALRPTCRRSPASTPRSTAASRRSRRCSRCRASSPTRACAATAFTGCPTSTSRRVLPRLMPRAGAGTDGVAHLGNGASMCALQRTAAASRPRWASPPSTGCRWARAAARSIRACCSTDGRARMDARAIEKLIYNQSGLLGVSGISSRHARRCSQSTRPTRQQARRPLRLSHRARARLARRRAGRPRRAGLHRRHRRARCGDPRPSRAGCGWLGRGARRGAQRARRRPRISSAGAPDPAWVMPDRRRADDRPPHPRNAWT